jgi:hypothetical protein
MKDNQQEKEEFARDDAIRAGCGCVLGIIAFIVILIFGIYGK